MCRSIQRFNTSILENLWAFDCRPCPVSGEFESCLAGVGNLNRKCQVFPVRIQGVLILNMQVFKGKEFTFTRKIVRRCFCLFYKKNWPSTPVFQMGQLNTISAPRGGNINKPIFKNKMPGELPGVCLGRILKLRIDRRLNLIANPSSLTLVLQSKLNFAHTRKFLCINLKVFMNALRCQMFIFNIHATSVFYTEILLHNLFAVCKLTQKKS